MALQKRAIGPNVMYIDNENKLMFTHGEVTRARERYTKELAKRQAR